MSSILEIRSLSMQYGDAVVLRDISMSIAEGELVVVIGNNSAGKTSLLRTISGLVRSSQGEIEFRGERVERLSVHEIARRRLIHVAEGRKLFPALTVWENLELGGYVEGRLDPKQLERVLALLPVLEKKFSQRAGTLSGGEQQMLAIGRALMAMPVLLMLDEPSIGLSPLIARQVLDAVSEIRREMKVTILLVEQNVRLALPLGDRALVLEQGVMSDISDPKSFLFDANRRMRYLHSQIHKAERQYP